ncbi:MAG TPA: ABC transporter ATP-binding protein [Gemmataceae bacterium]|jgi:ATP-binding cassette subfamily B protein|nr:ABC transporter ATP-binding protein [Gemmataceae bacterium]
MDQSAFSRVKDLLRYARPATVTATLAGIGAGVCYVLLIVLLALAVDLIVTRGRVPNFAQLPVREQENVLKEWAAIPQDQRERAVQRVGFAEFASPPAKTEATGPEQAARYRQYQSLVAADATLPPVPGNATSEALRDWAAKRGVVEDPYFAAALEHEWRWRAYVRHVLRLRVGDEAADKYQPVVESPDSFVTPGLGEENRKSFGILGLVVRHRNAPWGRVEGTFASAAGWTWKGEDANRSYLTGLLVLALFLVLLRGVLSVVSNEAAARASLEAVTRLRRSLYHHTARQGAMTISPGAVDEAGTLFNRKAEDIHAALYFHLTHTLRNATQFILLLVVALLTHFWLAIAFVLVALVVWSVSGQIAVSFRRQSRVATRVASNRLDLLLESLRQMRLVKSYLMELFNQSRVERQLSDYSRAHLRRTRGDSLVKPLLFAVGGMAAIALFYMAGMVVLHEGLSVAGLILLTVSFLSLYFPVRGRLSGRRTMRHGREAAAAIYEFLDRKGDVAQYPDADFFGGLSRGVEFADVTVREPGTGRLLLNRLNFKVKAGQQVGIVGSDAEETLALVSLIPRFLDPTDGEVKLDGRSVKWVTQDSLRAQVGMVLQSSLTFNDTVANNIGCGDPSYTLPQIIEAAKLAHAHQFIQRLPYGYETPIGEFGHSLNLGQQFRIALARVILRDPSLYVIEETHEPLDDDTKDLVDDTLDRVLPGKTVIYLPHRVSTLRGCNKIVLLHEGRVAAQGEHRELIGDNELYRHLYYLEYNPFAADAPAG